METQAYTIIFYARNSVCVDRLNFYNAQNWINMHISIGFILNLCTKLGKKQEKEEKKCVDLTYAVQIPKFKMPVTSHVWTTLVSPKKHCKCHDFFTYKNVQDSAISEIHGCSQTTITAALLLPLGSSIKVIQSWRDRIWCNNA